MIMTAKGKTTMKKVSDSTLEKLMEIVHKNIPELENRKDLEARNSDSEDFFETSVWSLRDALIEAYELGKNS